MRALIGFKRVVFAVVAAMGITASAKTLYVSPLGDGSAPQAGYATGYATIAAAVAAAEDGDVVQLARATHFLNATITVEKPITIQGEFALGTIIKPAKGAGDINAFTLNCADAVLSQVKITGFANPYGAAVKITGAGGTFVDSIVTDCTLSGGSSGTGAVYVESAAGVVRRCSITNCKGGNWGGGLYIHKANGTVDSCFFSGCSANYGGGIYVESDCNPTVVNVTAVGSSAGTDKSGDLYNYRPGADQFFNCYFQAFSGNDISGDVNIVGQTATDDELLDQGVTVDGASETDVNGFPYNTTRPIGCDSFNGFTGELTWEGPATMTSYTDYTIDVGFVTAEQGVSVVYSVYDPFDVLVAQTSETTIPFTTTGATGDYQLFAEATIDGIHKVWATVTLGKSYPSCIHVSSNGAGVAPYDTPETAYADLQKAIDDCADGGTVLVFDGVYNFGKTIKLEKPVYVKSVSGRGVTTVSGGNARCPFKLNHAEAALDGFTITDGSDGAVTFGENGGVVDNCIIENCTRGAHGAGLQITTSNAHVRRTIIRNCTSSGAGSYGGGIWVKASTWGATVEDCLIYGNSAAWGSGVYLEQGGRCAFLNCTVIDNKGGNGTGRDLYVYKAMAAITNVVAALYYNDAGTVTSDCFLRTATFKDTASGDYTPVEGDPAVDGGVDYEGMLETDVYGKPRKIGEAVDVGAAEYNSASLAVSVTAETREGAYSSELAFVLTPTVDGVSPEDVRLEWSFIQDKVVLASAETACEPYQFHPPKAGRFTVRIVAKGAGQTAEASVENMFYVSGAPTLFVDENGGNVSPYATAATAAHNFDDAWQYAGSGSVVRVAAGTYVTSRELKMSEQIQLIGAGRDQTTIRLADGAKTRVADLNNAASAIIGCTLAGGRQALSDAVSDQKGGGVRIGAKGGLIEDCRVTDCQTSGTQQGGGVAVLSGARNAVVRRTIIDGNVAGNHGGGIYSAATDFVCENCLIAGNSAQWGGGLYLEDGSRGAFTNCTVCANSAGASAANSYEVYFGPAFENYSFANTMLVHSNGLPGLSKQGDVLTDEAQAAFRACFSHCNVSGMTSYNGDASGKTVPIPEGNGNVSVADCFMDAAANDYHLAKKSPLASAGHFEPWMKTATDLDGLPRANGKRVSIGCYQQGLKGLIIMFQ